MHFLSIIAVFEALFSHVGLVITALQQVHIILHLFVVIVYLSLRILLVQWSIEVNHDWITAASISLNTSLNEFDIGPGSARFIFCNDLEKLLILENFNMSWRVVLILILFVSEYENVLLPQCHLVLLFGCTALHALAEVATSHLHGLAEFLRFSTALVCLKGSFLLILGVFCTFLYALGLWAASLCRETLTSLGVGRLIHHFVFNVFFVCLTAFNCAQKILPYPFYRQLIWLIEFGKLAAITFVLSLSFGNKHRIRLLFVIKEACVREDHFTAIEVLCVFRRQKQFYELLE